MREGWAEDTLGSTCEIYQPKTISAKEMNPDGDYPVFGANGIIGRYDQFNHENPQLLVTCRGATCGAVNVSLPKSWITGNAMVVRPRSLGLSVRFLEYFFRGACDFSKVITGAAQPQITRQTLAPVKISFPPLPEQQRIVAILDEAFARLATATANAEKNLKNARELFDSYLNSIFENDEGLRKVTLGDVCSISSRLVDPRKPEFLDLPHLGAGNMASRTGELSDIKTAREEGLKSGKFLFDSTMVLYSKIRPYLMKACRPDFDGLCSADVYPLSPDSDQLSRDFLFHLLMSKNFTDFAISGSDRAGMPKVNRDHLFKYRVNLPNIEEQALLANKLDEISNEANRLVAFYERRLIDLADLKQSVLRKAFSDELTSPPSQAIKEAAE